MPMRAADRIAIVGTTGCGKSTLARALLGLFQVRKVVIDPKADIRIDGALRARGIAELEAALAGPAGLIRFVPTSTEAAHYGEAYAAVFRRREPIMMLSDELYSVGTASSTDQRVRILLTQGRSRHKGHIGLTQRPRRICVEALSEADHLICFGPPPRSADIKALAPDMGLEDVELAARLRQLEPHAALWFDRREQTLRVIDPV
jgi:ABC-type cobalamin/Fe3+-siderophores transport system ATPase subunit